MLAGFKHEWTYEVTGRARVPLSVLDLVLVSEGSTPRQALDDSIDLAVQAEALGYHRFWLAEHHLYPGGAGGAAYMLAPLIARATDRIRVGTAVTVIDNYSPVHVAEIAGTAAALGGRGFDLGIGRGGPSPEVRARNVANVAKVAAGELSFGPVGPTRDVDGVTVPSFSITPFNDARAALNDELLSRTPGNPADFSTQVSDVLGFLDGSYLSSSGLGVVASPARDADVDVWVHGSSPGLSASVAGSKGLPFGANYHNFPQLVIETVQAYRDAFVPSARLGKPYVIVSADILVAETDERAGWLASPFGPWLYTIRTEYAAQPYLSPDAAAAVDWDDAHTAIVADRVAARIVGSPATVVARLAALVAATGADELLVTTQAHAHTDRVTSYRLLADAWNAGA
jgi:alkanesulfonate monooxygenase SsuD/methylene tetrahydromethanopterin reductase-like flavin-dependent oxidoreductase (luciferase family)